MLWVHAAWCTMRTICMSAYMRRTLRHLHFVDFIIFFYNILKIFLPMQSYHRHLILIQIQNPTLPPTIGSTFGFLRFWIMRLKHSQTSSCIGITLFPASVFGGSMIYRIWLVLCNWWYMLIVFSFKLISFIVNPTNSEIRIPV